MDFLGKRALEKEELRPAEIRCPTYTHAVLTDSDREFVGCTARGHHVYMRGHSCEISIDMLVVDHLFDHLLEQVIHLRFYVRLCVCVCLCVCLSIRPSVSVWLAVCLCACLPASTCVFLSIDLSVCLPACLSVCGCTCVQEQAILALCNVGFLQRKLQMQVYSSMHVCSSDSRTYIDAHQCQYIHISHRHIKM